MELAGSRRKQKRLAVERLVFVDELSVNTAMTPAYARSPRGERVQGSEPFNHGSNVSVISSLSPADVGATMSVDGAVDAQVFDAFVKNFLIPTLFEGDIVALDRDPALSKGPNRAQAPELLAKAIEKVTAHDICGWFAHCGYTYSFI